MVVITYCMSEIKPDETAAVYDDKKMTTVSLSQETKDRLGLYVAKSDSWNEGISKLLDVVEKEELETAIIKEGNR